MSTVSAPVTIRLLSGDDHAVFDSIAPGVFDNPIAPIWMAEFLADPRHHMTVALLGNQIVGMASAVHYVHPDKPPELWINEVGVADDYREQGIGKRLMQVLLDSGTHWDAPRRGWGPSRRTSPHVGCTPQSAVSSSPWCTSLSR